MNVSLVVCRCISNSKTTKPFSIKVISIDYLGGRLKLIFSSLLDCYTMAHTQILLKQHSEKNYYFFWNLK